MQSAIELIEKKCSPYFIENNIRFKQSGLNTYIISGYTTPAINNKKNDVSEVKVLNWFGDFWVYIELNFVPIPKKFPRTSVSISIFHGEATDEIKSQLFRAEWDNYPDNTVHPQPHWHFYPVEQKPKYYEDFKAFLDIVEDDSFANELADNTANKNLDLRRIHFAMDARWADSGVFIHEITNEEMIANWMSGILKCIRQQLEYIGS
ncbi:hypothetical protein [Hymenobacter guriensis]|uniref:DUF4304 domain-containing protein n=1 Tax=Hymenobacter guriensis TaxID=2793065 RepID=A0ABS0KYX7_9BACT|nr:hypothetical protein [Hymenobacter guriensis]MBG8552568.1 hypothetical protein [Hymenobacter guriensis]